jgi:predicted GNAT superfamily acetyltransferase
MPEGRVLRGVSEKGGLWVRSKEVELESESQGEEAKTEDHPKPDPRRLGTLRGEGFRTDHRAPFTRVRTLSLQAPSFVFESRHRTRTRLPGPVEPRGGVLDSLLMSSEEARIRPANGRADFDACVRVQQTIWGVEVTPALEMIATTFAGGSVFLAETVEGRVVGFAYAFPALRGGIGHLHSDMLAVLPEFRKQGVGVRLKWTQREEALSRGIGLITWTFDPLEARNAHLNLRRLGGIATEFLENFYGMTGSALHHGLPTDRLLVRWELGAGRVVEHATQGEPSPTVPTPSLSRINDVKWQAGWPVSSDPRTDLDEAELLLEIPPDFDVLCQAAPRVAEDWHRKIRTALKFYVGRGYQAADFAPTEERGRRRPLYILRKG